MKHRLLNIFVWITAGVLAIVLYHLLTAQSPASSPPAISASYPREMASLIQQRQQLEKELQNLDQEKKNAGIGPTSIFVMINTTQEDIIQQAASMMDTLQLPALMGVSQAMLETWAQQGLPDYVTDRLSHGWELCILLETTQPVQMQNALSALQLPPAIVAYDTPLNEMTITAEELLACGITILVEDNLNAKDRQDGLWRIGSIGNMNGDGIYLYEQYRNTGAALVNVIGHYRADQTYVKENLEGLLELIREDSQLGTVQCLRLNTAMYYHQQFTKRLAMAQEEWSTKRAVLEKELQTVMEQITKASNVLNQ